MAAFLVLHWRLWVEGALAAEAEDPSKTDALNRQIDDLYRAGKYQEAIPVAQRLLEFREKINGPEHPDTATSLNNLAALYYSIGDYAKAEPLYRRALAIREKALGPEHPNTAASLENLAFLNIDSGKAGDALEFGKHAQKAQETHLGKILSFTSEQQRLAFEGQPILSRFWPRWAAHLILPKQFCTIKGWCSIHCWKTAWWPKPARIQSSVKSLTNCVRPNSGIRNC